jgi:hypothetical protein
MRSRLKSSLSPVWSVLVSALTWFFLTRAAGAAIAVTGVYVLAGFGWALIAGGVLLLAVSEFIRQGLIARG